MNNTKIDAKNLTRLVCAMLLLAVFAMQFLPFWHYGEQNEISRSINGYIWFPTDHNDLTSHLQTVVRADYKIEQILVVPIASMILSAVGCVLCFFKRDQFYTMLFPFFCGLIGLFGYLREPVFRLGNGWQIHMLLYAALLILSIYSLMPIINDIKAAISARFNGGNVGKNRNA